VVDLVRDICPTISGKPVAKTGKRQSTTSVRNYGCQLDAALTAAGVEFGSRLVWLPSGALGLLPLGLAQDPASGRRLGDSYEIVYVPSREAVARAQRRLSQPLPLSLCAVVNPIGDLPHAEAEIELIASHFPEPRRRSRLFPWARWASCVMQFAGWRWRWMNTPRRGCSVLSLRLPSGRWDRNLLNVDRCPFWGWPHYHALSDVGLIDGRLVLGCAYGEVLDSHCRDNRRRDRADRRYLLVEPSPARERARLAIRALLKEQLGPSPSEVDVAMKRGLEALLW
jgi:CHAT domain